MLLRDEEDIIAQNFDHLLTWIDALYVLDLGSTDRTWEIVQDYARRDPRIVPYLHRPILYNDNLRAVLFDQFRDRFSPGDWVMKIDADEFYHVAPPQFVKERLRAGETSVHLQWYFFRLTQEEVEAYESGRVSIEEDRRRPIDQRRRYYKISEYSEPRMFRYRPSMQWPEDVSFPYNAGFVARERIPIRHYPHRDPQQMARRFRLRSAMMKLNAHAGGHWKLDDWRKEVIDLQADPTGNTESTRPGEGLNVLSQLAGGSLHHLPAGQTLVEAPLYNHLNDWKQRFQQRVVHPLLLPLLDRRRRRYDRSFKPTGIDPAVNAQIV